MADTTFVAGTVVTSEWLNSVNDAVYTTLPETTDKALQAWTIQNNRTAPHANFNWFTSDFTVTGSAGVGRAYVLQDIKDVFLSKFSPFMTGSTTYVDATNGSDANSGGITDPWATIDKALRTSISGTVLVMPGNYSATGFRYTDTQGDRPKALIAPYSGVRITPSGDILASAVWTPNATYGNVYETTLATANHVIRILDNSSLDELGLASPLQKYSSLLETNNSGRGWWYDAATQKCYIRMGVLNVETIKTRFEGIYAIGGDNSFLVLDAALYLENITLDGYVFVLNSTTPARPPQVWMKNCTLRYANSNSRNIFGGYCYSQGCTYYRSAADHANYNITNSVVAQGVEINDLSWYAGDVATYGSAATQPSNPVSVDQNKNSSSNHDSYVVRMGGVHQKAYGPIIADTSTSYSWNLGVSCGYSYATGVSRYGWIVQGSAFAWLDGCQAGQGNLGINSDGGALIYTFNSFGPQVTSSSGTFSTYTPV